MCNNNEKSDILSLQLPNKISRVHITSRKTYNPITIKNSKLWLYIEHGHKKNMWLCVYLPFNSFRSRAKWFTCFSNFWYSKFLWPKYVRNCCSDWQQKCFQPCWNVSKHTSSITTRQIVVKTNVCIEIFFMMFKDLYCSYVQKMRGLWDIIVVYCLYKKIAILLDV